MAKLTRLQIKDYIRSLVGEFDSDRINSSTLDEDINLAQRKIQMDMLELGIKQFTKTVYNTGAYQTVPSDIIFHPNAIIDVEASSGVRAAGTINFTASKSLTISFLEPGTGGNTWELNFTDDAAYTTPAVISYNIASKTLVIKYKSGTTTMADLTSLFSTNIILKSLFTVTASGTGAVTQNETKATLTGGSGNAWKPADERTIERFNRVKNNSYKTGTVDEPIYRRLGDGTPSQILEFYPTSIVYTKIYYYYLLADLTADTDYSGLPIEIEELLLVEIQRRVYIYLKKQAETEEQAVNYQRIIGSLSKKYTDMLTSSTFEEKKLDSADIN